MNHKKYLCPVCNKPFQKSLSTQKVCNYTCAIALVKKKNIDLSKKEILAIKKTKSEIEKYDKHITKEKRKDLTNWKDKLQNECQKSARIIDKGLTCLATKRRGQIHGGHILSKGSHSQCRFNLHNIHRQCAQSNHNHSDDYLMILGLENEYGSEYKDFVLNMKSWAVPKFSNIEYMEKYLELKKINIELSKGDYLTPKERIEARDMVNSKLKIYEVNFL